jgi:lantibiotic biosynthesis protein
MKGWQPLLSGTLAERARQAVDEIAAALAPAPGAADADLSNPTLCGGTAGVALFFAYRAGRGGGPGAAGDIDAAALLLERCTEALAVTPLAPDLYGGFSGVAWTAEHLYGPRFAAAATADPRSAAAPAPTSAGTETPSTPETPQTPQTPQTPEATELDAEDPLEEIDAGLLRYLDHSPWTADYDLIRGLAGFGVYALERLPRPSAVACLAKVVDRLAETAEHGPQGTTWHTAPELLPDWQRAIFPEGYYNLGVAHGVPAVVAMLGGAAAAAARMGAAGDPAAADLAERARSLGEGASRWLLAQQLPPGNSFRFGTTFSPEAPPQRSRLAWCYGDPGIAAALLVTARARGDAALEQLAIELALEAANRPAELSGVRDAGLCHGSAGLAHLFNRMYQETGEPRLGAISRRWFEHALDFRQPGQGLAGYLTFQFEDDAVTEKWRADPGLLEGVAGIGLALLGGLGDFEPAWDRVLMLSAAGVDPALP